MKQNIYSVYDSKAAAYMAPFFQRTDGEAMRSFTNACNDTSSPFHNHAEDFTLFKLAVFDDNDGSIDPLTTPEPLIKASQLVAPRPQETSAFGNK